MVVGGGGDYGYGVGAEGYVGRDYGGGFDEGCGADSSCPVGYGCRFCVCCSLLLGGLAEIP